MVIRMLPVVFAALVGLLLSGCLESDEHYTLNPDGSGKVVVDATVGDSRSLFGVQDEEVQNPKERVREFVESILENSNGVDTWKDITCTVAGDKIRFKGTAYFKDLNDLKIYQISSSNTFIREDNGDGSWQLRLKADTSRAEGGGEPAENLSEEEIADRIDSLRGQYEMGRAMIGPVLEGIKQRYVFNLPGTASAYTTFKRLPDGGYEYAFTGSKMLALMDSVTASDSFWREAVVKGGDIPADRQQELAKIMFGDGGLPSVTVSGGAKNRFNYNAEVAAARKKYPAMLKKFGIKQG